MCHVPFVFYSGKESLLIVIDELNRKSISNALWHKLQNNNHFSIAPENENAPNPDLPIPGDENKMSFASIVVRQSQGGDQNLGIKSSRLQSKAIMSQVTAAQA